MRASYRSQLTVAALLLQQLALLGLAIFAGGPACERACCLRRPARTGASCAYHPKAETLAETPPEAKMSCHEEGASAPESGDWAISCAISARCSHSAPGWTSLGDRFGVLTAAVELAFSPSVVPLTTPERLRRWPLLSGPEPPPPRIFLG